MAAGVPSTNQVVPFSREALQLKSKLGASLELPGLFYSQYTPTPYSGAATATTAMSLIGQNNLGYAAGSALNGQTVVTQAANIFTLSAGASWLSSTGLCNGMPVQFVVGVAGATLPAPLLFNTTYYIVYINTTTFSVSLTPGGATLNLVGTYSGTIWAQPSALYWGNSTLPAGFLQVSDVLNQSTPTSFPAPGCHIRGEIWGTATSAGTPTQTITAGLINTAGTYTAFDAGNTVAMAAVGPFLFTYSFDMVVAQYGLAAISPPYTTVGYLRTCGQTTLYTAAGTLVQTHNIPTLSAAIDLTQSYTIDVRAACSTAVATTVLSPFAVKLWAYN